MIVCRADVTSSCYDGACQTHAIVLILDNLDSIWSEGMLSLLHIPPPAILILCGGVQACQARPRTAARQPQQAARLRSQQRSAPRAQGHGGPRRLP